MHKIKIFIFSICGEFIKILCRIGLISIPYGINMAEDRKEKIIVSLTSYGRRVSSVLPFAIISLLRQTYKPDMILLWLDSKNWNDDNLPKSLRELKKYGLTIKYCDDVKSYKKLVPTLKLFPDAIIVTCDDDLYYRDTMLKRLIVEYTKNPTNIYTHRAHRVGFTITGELENYNDWEEEISGETGNRVFPTGGAGCLYKKSFLYRDACDANLFMELAPNADDVWFYFMELLQGTPRVVLPNKGYVYIPLDTFYQHFHVGANLYSKNCLESQNDIQIRNIMNYYNISVKDLL